MRHASLKILIVAIGILQLNCENPAVPQGEPSKVNSASYFNGKLDGVAWTGTASCSFRADYSILIRSTMEFDGYAKHINISVPTALSGVYCIQSQAASMTIVYGGDAVGDHHLSFGRIQDSITIINDTLHNIISGKCSFELVHDADTIQFTDGTFNIPYLI